MVSPGAQASRPRRAEGREPRADNVNEMEGPAVSAHWLATKHIVGTSASTLEAFARWLANPMPASLAAAMRGGVESDCSTIHAVSSG